MSKSFCYKTFENYNVPRDQVKSFCKSGAKSGYYNISSTRGICNDGQCRVKENFEPIPSTAWQQPAAVRGTWNQVKGLYELNPQSNSCVGWRGGNQEGYESGNWPCCLKPEPNGLSGSCCTSGRIPTTTAPPSGFRCNPTKSGGCNVCKKCCNEFIPSDLCKACFKEHCNDRSAKSKKLPSCCGPPGSDPAAGLLKCCGSRP